MRKVNEYVDLSKTVLEVDIKSPIFEEALSNLNEDIQMVVKKVYDNEFEGGEITLKLNIEIPEDYKVLPKQNEFGEMVGETYVYRKPKIKHTVTTVLKNQFKEEGTFEEEREIQYKDKKFVAAPIANPQISIDDL